jgi:IS5 family transposase
MLRALLLQQWYGLSDPGLEEALSDLVSSGTSAGWRWRSRRQPAPAEAGETTLCRFPLALVAAGLGDALFAEVSRQLETAGFMVEAGTLIDASLAQAAVRQPPNGSSPMGQESRSPHDPDADRTRTACGTKRFFGDKIHVGVDQGSGIIRSRMVAPAGVHESEVADDLVIGDEKAVYADKAYGKQARRETRLWRDDARLWQRSRLRRGELVGYAEESFAGKPRPLTPPLAPAC